MKYGNKPHFYLTNKSLRFNNKIKVETLKNWTLKIDVIYRRLFQCLLIYQIRQMNKTKSSMIKKFKAINIENLDLVIFNISSILNLSLNKAKYTNIFLIFLSNFA